MKDKIDNGEEIYTGYMDEEIPKRKSSVGCDRKGCMGGYIMLPNGAMDYCKCYYEYQFKLGLKKAGIPPEYHDIDEVKVDGLKSARKMYSANMGTAKLIDINSMLENYETNLSRVKEEGWNMIFEGPTGCGKTTAACICAKYAVNKGYSVLFAELQDLRKIWTGEQLSKELETLKKDLHNVDFLILDDLGHEFLSDRSDHQLTEMDLLLRKRTSKQLVTIFTTNNNYEDIVKRYDERIASLLKRRMVHIIMKKDTDLREDTGIPDFLFGE